MFRRTRILLPATLVATLLRRVPRPLLWLVAACAMIATLGSPLEIGAADPPFKFVVRRFGFLPVESPLGTLPLEPSMSVRDAKAIDSKTLGMNNHGDIVGCGGYEAICDEGEFYGETISWLYAFHYTRGGQLLNLSKQWDSWGLQDLQDNLNIGLNMGYAEDINDSNEIVGATASDLDGADAITTVRCTPPTVPGGPATFLALCNGFGGPLSINSSGDVLGRDFDETRLYIEGTGLVTIPRYNNTYLVTPQAMNDSREIVGYSYPTRALRYSFSGGFKTLSMQSLATDINNSGDVTGYAYFRPQAGSEHAFWWYFENGTERVKDIGTLGGKWSHASSINNAADRSKVKIVGNSTNKRGVNRPFIYTSATGMVDLLSCIVGEMVIDPISGEEVRVPPDPAWGFTPVSVNDAGQIAGDLCGGIPWQSVRLDPVSN